MTALTKVRETMGLLRDYSLCHREFGNADLLIHASLLLKDEAGLVPAHAAAEKGH